MRSDMRLKNYGYLREASNESFTSIKLINILTCPTGYEDLHEPYVNPPNIYECYYCHGDFHHLIPCPLRLVPGFRAKNTHGVARGIEIKKDSTRDRNKIVKEAITNIK
jgi:hypothetical protein